jgi:hypothetical protein
MSMMTLLSTKAEVSIIASEFVHDFVGRFTAHLILPDPDDGFDALAALGLGGFPMGIWVGRGETDCEDFPRFRFHRALMAGGTEAESLFHAFIEIPNCQCGAHGWKLSNASIAVNADLAQCGEGISNPFSIVAFSFMRVVGR